MLITTSIDLPGYDIVAVQGEVFGLTVRPRDIGVGCMAALRSLGGGEIPEFTKL
ncbi:MAG TPA: heavy metal-binding domain-containing protein [Acidimicrobiales bacterium]|nr:heavy metal-binding domain-containing protein [Acidimicrobiales bacterium]